MPNDTMPGLPPRAKPCMMPSGRLPAAAPLEENAKLNEVEQEKLRKRAAQALRATQIHNSRGPKTFAVRRSLTQWLESGVFQPPGYLAMTTPAEACRWLEYVTSSERGRARLNAIWRKACETEETAE